MFWKLITLLLEFDSALDVSDLTIVGTNVTFWTSTFKSNISRFSQISFLQLTNSSHLIPEVNVPAFLVFDMTEMVDPQGEETLRRILGILRQKVAPDSSTTKKPSTITCIILDERFTDFEKTFRRVVKTELPKAFQISSRLYFWPKNSPALVETYFTKESLTLEALNNRNLVHSPSYRRRNFKSQIITVANQNAWGTGISRSGSTTISRIGGWSLSKRPVHNIQAGYFSFSAAFMGHSDWVTMFESMRTGRADIAGTTPMVIAPNFAKDLRYLSTPTVQQRLVIYFSTPDGSKTVTELFHVKPFQWKTWLAILLTMALLYLIHYLMPSTDSSGGDSFLYVLSVMAMQGYNIEDKTPVRILTFSGFVLFSVLNGVYAAGLISCLSTRHEQNYDLEMLVNRGYSFGFQNDSYLHGTKLFGNSVVHESHDLKEMFSHMHPTMGQTDDIPNGIQYVLNHKKYAFVTEENAFLIIFPDGAHMHFDNATICNNLRYTEIPHFLVLKAPIIRPDSPFAQHFNMARQRMRETGIWHRHNKEIEQMSRNSLPDCPTASSLLRRLEASDVLLPAIFLSSGILLCIICFVWEFMHGLRKVKPLQFPTNITSKEVYSLDKLEMKKVRNPGVEHDVRCQYSQVLYPN